MIEQITVTIPQKIYRRVRQLARLRNQPVDAVLVDVLDRALLADESYPNNNEDDVVEREMQAFIQMHPLLKEKYLGQHVAKIMGLFMNALMPNTRINLSGWQWLKVSQSLHLSFVLLD